MIDPWYEEHLVCPVDQTELRYSNDALRSPSGRVYPVVDGVPVMLVEEVEHTHPIAAVSMRRAGGDQSVIDQRAPHLHLETLTLSDASKDGIVALSNQPDMKVDPAVSYLIGTTSGFTVGHMIGNLQSYPIPGIRLPDAKDKTFLDLGSNWGRWCIAAARKGYAAVGIDPSLGAIMAARRVAKQMELPIRYIVGDARFLPFRDSTFDVVHSYSVLQHLKKEYVKTALSSARRVMKNDGISFIQLPNYIGIRCLQHQFRRRFRAARGNEVRYWSVPELRRTFQELVGASTITVDCYFGLGLQPDYARFMPWSTKSLIHISETLRKLSLRLGVLKYVADSLYVTSTKSEEPASAGPASG
jgi:SAM-dependent methyltransferase/uncharacterized protein YbaR (Trm112 family)